LRHGLEPVIDASECQYNASGAEAFFSRFFEITPLWEGGAQGGNPPQIEVLRGENEGSGSQGGNTPLRGEKTFTIADEGSPRKLVEDPSFEFPVLMFNNFPETFEVRHRLHSLAEHIRFTEEVLTEVDRFWQANCTGPMVGVHMRATDYNLYEFAYMLNNPDLLRESRDVVPHIADFVFGAKDFLRNHPDAKVLVATDSAFAYGALMFFECIRGKYIRYPSTFLKDRSRPEHRVRDAGGDGEKMAREILTEVLLLSRCNHLVSSYSNVSAMVLALNPTMTHLNVSSRLKRDRSDGGIGRHASL